MYTANAKLKFLAFLALCHLCQLVQLVASNCVHDCILTYLGAVYMEGGRS